MSGRAFTPEQIINKLREAEVLLTCPPPKKLIQVEC